jgi:hypothetical protein
MEQENMTIVNITPYKELRFGDKSIYDYVGDIETDIPSKVVDYLRAGNPDVMSPGIYDHPFREGEKLLGPYILTDNTRYSWDRDTWKYVVKYGLKLPEEFIEFVLSDEGSEALEGMRAGTTWSEVIQGWKKTSSASIYLPEDAGDNELDSF